MLVGGGGGAARAARLVRAPAAARPPRAGDASPRPGERPRRTARGAGGGGRAGAGDPDRAAPVRPARLPELRDVVRDERKRCRSAPARRRPRAARRQGGGDRAGDRAGRCATAASSPTSCRPRPCPSRCSRRSGTSAGSGCWSRRPRVRALCSPTGCAPRRPRRRRPPVPHACPSRWTPRRCARPTWSRSPRPPPSRALSRRSATRALDGLRAASIGPVTSAALREHGVEPAAEADPHTVDGLVAAVERLLAPAG